MYWNNLKQSSVLHRLYGLSAPATKQYTNLTIIFKRSAPFNTVCLTHLSLLWDIGKQNSPRCDAAERGVPSGAILFAYRIFIEKLNKI